MVAIINADIIWNLRMAGKIHALLCYVYNVIKFLSTTSSEFWIYVFIKNYISALLNLIHSLVDSLIKYTFVGDVRFKLKSILNLKSTTKILILMRSSVVNKTKITGEYPSCSRTFRNAYVEITYLNHLFKVFFFSLRDHDSIVPNCILTQVHHNYVRYSPWLYLESSSNFTISLMTLFLTLKESVIEKTTSFPINIEAFASIANFFIFKIAIGRWHFIPLIRFIAVSIY